MQKIIGDPDWPIDFLLGWAKNFQIGGGMQSHVSMFQVYDTDLKDLYFAWARPTKTISLYIHV